MMRSWPVKHELGLGLTEAASVLPILAALLHGVIQFGIAFNNHITLTDAVRAGARKGAVARHLTENREAAVEQTVVDPATDLKLDDLDVTVGVSPGWEQGADVT